MPRVGARVGNKKLGAIDHSKILPRAESYALNALVYFRDVDASAKDPNDLHIWVVFKEIFGEVSRVAAILFVVVCPA